jgi:hypothetical protein
MDTTTRTPMTRVTVAALLTAAAGIVIQILAGTDYPVVPPGLVILLAAAAFVWWAPWRWAPAVGAVAALSQLVGLFAAGQAPRLVELDPVADTVGLWVQLVSVTVAVVAGAASVAWDRRVPLR